MTKSFKPHSPMVVIILTILFLNSIYVPSIVLAGDTYIKYGTVNTETITRDGKSSTVTKTYYYDKVVVNVKVYDMSGKLIKDTTTEKPLGDRVHVIDGDPEQAKKAEYEQYLKTADPKSLKKPKAITAPQNTKIPTETIKTTDKALIATQSSDINLRELRLQEYREKIYQKAVKDRQLNDVKVLTTNSDEFSNVVIIEGKKNKKLFGLVTISIPEKLSYEADSQTLLSSEKSGIWNILDKLSR